jgi:hypothetical protein
MLRTFNTRTTGPSTSPAITPNTLSWKRSQAVVRQYGQFKVTGKTPTNFLRHYYDIHQLLEVEAVQKFSKIAG